MIARALRPLASSARLAAIAGGLALAAPAADCAAQAFTQADKITAGNTDTLDEFGSSLAVSGSSFIVGARASFCDGFCYDGYAYIFERNGLAWEEVDELIAADTDDLDLFGASVGLSGSTAIVGAPQHPDQSGVGAAFIFVKGFSWVETAKLTAHDAAEGDYFGWSVAIDGNTAVVGAPRYGSDGIGAAYVYVKSISGWTETAKLTADDAAEGDYFGWSVAIDGYHVLVGAPYAMHGGAATGAVYAFAKIGTAWTQLAKLVPADASSGDDFGSSVALDGSTAIAGAPETSTGAGSAYVFRYDGSMWAQQAKLTASDGLGGDDFGGSVAIGGAMAVVGAPQFGPTGDGTAYVFMDTGAAWMQVDKLTPSDDFLYFGSAVGISGTDVLVGDSGNDEEGQYSGAVYHFDTGCGVIITGPCCSANGSPYCADPGCCTLVCANDPFCCNTQWDGICADQASQVCGCACGGAGAGDCCVANGTPYCNDEACCDAVCAIDPDCCNVEWDGSCAFQAILNCASCFVCGTPAAGDCCTANGTPACESVACCTAVCAIDEFCCATQWDQACASQAIVSCGTCPACGDPDAGDCCSDNGTPYCNDVVCCEAVCAIDGFCCVAQWDEFCAAEATDVCAACLTCGDPATGDCCSANGTPSCDDAACCQEVCSADPFCCNVEWDGICADQALQVCAMCFTCGAPGTGDCCEANGSPGCDDAACCQAVCSADPFCCSAAWDGLCADEAMQSCAACLQPANDDCANALPILDGDTVFSNLEATDDGTPLPGSCDEGAGLAFGSDIWFVYEPVCNGTLTVSTCNQADYDTRLAAYSGSCGGLLVACNDDAPGCGLSSFMEVPVTCGEPVLLRVGGYAGAQGSGTLSLSCSGGPCVQPGCGGGACPRAAGAPRAWPVCRRLRRHRPAGR